MARQLIRIRTTAPLEDAAGLFRQAMRVSWVSENITGAGTQFGTPPASAFDSLDKDPPTFSVMAVLGGRGAEIQQSAVFLHAWDRGDHREIVMTVGKSLGALGIKANSKMRKFVAALRLTDPAAECEGLSNVVVRPG
jgi:hypothetical protein